MLPSSLPPADFTLSPSTGWTRAHWTALADHTVRSVRPYASPGHGLIGLPGPASRAGRLSDGLEGFARTFLAAAFRIAGDPTAPEATELARWYARGLVSGTDPASGETWPALHDVHQARVEAASVAIALHETRGQIWDTLSDSEQQRVVDWLSGSVGVTYPNNNWVWFQNIVQAFLASVGAPTRREDIERNLARVEEWYSGDGWYTDGAGPDGEHRAYDHYAGWAMHFYPLWWSRMLGADADPVRTSTDRDRLRSWLGQAQHLVGADGPPLFQGRSLTYRFATLAPFWVGAVFDATPLSPGRTRRLASGTLRYFAERGAWNAAGLQPIGWHGAFTPIRQGYSGPGSPYWSSKGFAGLVLPDDHPVWTRREEPLLTEEHDTALSLGPPGWLVSTTKADRLVRVVNHGSDQQPTRWFGLDDTVYGRIGYSNATAPDSGLRAETSPVDSCVALVDSRGRASHRRPLRRLSLGTRTAVSRHRAHWLVGPARDLWFETAGPPHRFEAGPWLTVASVLRGPVEVRVIRVDMDPDPLSGPDMDAEGNRAAVAAGPWHLRIGGYPLADGEPPTGECPTNAAEVSLRTGRPLRSTVVGLVGRWNGTVERTAGANPMGRHSAVPQLRSALPVEDGQVTAVAVTLTGESDPLAPMMPNVVMTEDGDGCAVDVAWSDGEFDRLRLDPPRV